MFLGNWIKENPEVLRTHESRARVFINTKDLQVINSLGTSCKFAIARKQPAGLSIKLKLSE